MPRQIRTWRLVSTGRLSATECVGVLAVRGSGPYVRCQVFRQGAANASQGERNCFGCPVALPPVRRRPVLDGSCVWEQGVAPWVVGGELVEEQIMQEPCDLDSKKRVRTHKGNPGHGYAFMPARTTGPAGGRALLGVRIPSGLSWWPMVQRYQWACADTFHTSDFPHVVPPQAFRPGEQFRAAQ